MIAGVITIITLLVIRLNGETRVALVLPQDYALPGGVQAQGFSILDDRIIVIGDDRVIRIFDIESRDMTQTMTIE